MAADQIQRCIIWWAPDTYYWLAPGDRDAWLEVTQHSFDEARESDPAVVAQILRDKLDGKRDEGGFPLRATKRWLQQQGAFHDGAQFDTVGGSSVVV